VPNPSPYPVNLDLRGRPVLVVGGGRVALRKVDGLLTAGARVTVVAPSVRPEMRGRPVVVRTRRYRTADLDGVRLVVTATDDHAVNQRVHDDAEARGIWVNAADDPERCTFTLPAVVRRGAVQVTVSTGGASPALAAGLRRRLEAELGPELAELAEALAERRAAVHAAGRSTEDVDWTPVIEAELRRLSA
jgi:precorrin-2 dehydrogenase / sirohydrochlorin ferrochelatase